VTWPVCSIRNEPKLSGLSLLFAAAESSLPFTSDFRKDPYGLAVNLYDDENIGQGAPKTTKLRSRMSLTDRNLLQL
jgi:hypothetical protein